MNKGINRFSKIITNDKSQGASQAMLYALKLKQQDMSKAQIAIGSNWFEGNPCNNHLNKLSKIVKYSINKQNLIGFRFNTIGVSDGITNGTKGMLYSLPSREIIADSYETMNIAHSYDGNIAIPGCDKNLPGCLMGMIRINRPSLMIYGGSIQPGTHKGCKIDIIDAFQSYGKYKSGQIDDKERDEIVKKACPGSGSCGGMYTANTMASAIESMGMMMPYSSTNPALSDEKINECNNIGPVINNLIVNNIKPSDIITKQSIVNGIITAISLGGSTNLVIHMLAIAHTANIELSLNDFNEIGEKVPVIANLKPHGKYLMNDLHKIGGLPLVQKLLISKNLLNGNCLTITGKTLNDNVKNVDLSLLNNQNIINFEKPLKTNSHIKIIYGNLCPDGAVAKISGHEGDFFKGPAVVFESEKDFMEGLTNNMIKKGHVIVIRNQGPKGGPGMPEMLKPTSSIVGYGLNGKVAFITDGRFSGGSHGLIVGHVSPEAYCGGPIGRIENDQIITLDIKNKTCTVDNLSLPFTIKKIKNEKQIYKTDTLHNNTYLKKYRKLVGPSDKGCVTF